MTVSVRDSQIMTVSVRDSQTMTVSVRDSQTMTVSVRDGQAVIFLARNSQNIASDKFRYPFHPRVTAVARKRPRSFCQKCRWQVTVKHAYTLRMWLCMK